MKTAQLKKIINSNVEAVNPQLGEMNMVFFLYEINLGVVRVEVIRERQGIRFKLDDKSISAKSFDALNFKGK